mmetsp:Transcript_14485/g.42683  ORF Transcript_14485/g.42683 Transcript_14485/m.42683 type:complete len:326 (-) Transcript_14485:28-1005(-)
MSQNARPHTPCASLALPQFPASSTHLMPPHASSCCRLPPLRGSALLLLLLLIFGGEERVDRRRAEEAKHARGEQVEPERVEDERDRHRRPRDHKVCPREGCVRAVRHLVKQVRRRQDADHEEGDGPRDAVDEVEARALVAELQQDDAHVLPDVCHLGADKEEDDEQRAVPQRRVREEEDGEEVVAEQQRVADLLVREAKHRVVRHVPAREADGAQRERRRRCRQRGRVVRDGKLPQRLHREERRRQRRKERDDRIREEDEVVGGAIGSDDRRDQASPQHQQHTRRGKAPRKGLEEDGRLVAERLLDVGQRQEHANPARAPPGTEG